MSPASVKPAKSPRLKVYVTTLGFFEAVVAAPSQKAALKAWGVTQNLFAEGAARVVEDEALKAEALAKPGEIVRKPLSDDAGYMAAAKPVDRKARASKAPPRPDRSKLDAAERALERAEAALSKTTKALQQEQARLQARIDGLRSDGEVRLKALRDARDKARRAYAAEGNGA